jgi:hypothetical protein
MSTTKIILDDLGTAKSPSKLGIVCKIWPDAGLTPGVFPENEYGSFFDYIAQELSELNRCRSEFAAESLEATIDLIALLRKSVNDPLQSVLQKLRGLFPDVEESALIKTLELSARLWLTTRVTIGGKTLLSPRRGSETIEWFNEISLKEALQSHFCLLSQTNTSDQSFGPGLDPSFTASALVDICGIRLSWTSNLMDHMQLDKRHRVLTVYEHKICLLNHIKGIDSPFTLDLLQETLDTLNLLFPFGHGPTRELLRRENKLAMYGLGTCNRERRLAVGDYRAWRVRIMNLTEVFNEPPRNWWQLLNDRRDLREWATFWLGPMVLVLTVVSIVTGTVSSVYAVKQYNLARAQACAACTM